MAEAALVTPELVVPNFTAEQVAAASKVWNELWLPFRVVEVVRRHVCVTTE